jgi:hypothetical protein
MCNTNPVVLFFRFFFIMKYNLDDFIFCEFYIFDSACYITKQLLVRWLHEINKLLLDGTKLLLLLD